MKKKELPILKGALSFFQKFMSQGLTTKMVRDTAFLMRMKYNRYKECLAYKFCCVLYSTEKHSILWIILFSISILVLAIICSLGAMDIVLHTPISSGNIAYAIECGLAVGLFSIIVMLGAFLLFTPPKKLRKVILTTLLIILIGTIYNFLRWVIYAGC